MAKSKTPKPSKKVSKKITEKSVKEVEKPTKATKAEKPTKTAKPAKTAKEAEEVVAKEGREAYVVTKGPKDEGVTCTDTILDIPEKAIHNAIKGLRSLVDEDSLQAFTVNFTLANIPENPYTRHVLIPVPKGISTLADTDVCVIVPDGHKKEYEDKAELLDGVDMIIEKTQLMREYKEFKTKKELANAYDLFLCDRRLAPGVGYFLGKSFREKNKNPVLADLGHDGSNIGAMVQAVDLVKNSAKFLINVGKRISVTAGRSDMEDDDIASNIMPILQGVNAFFTQDAPEEFRNTIVKVDLMFRDTIPIPLYVHSVYAQ